MATETTVTELKINKLSKAQYDSIQNPSDTELYLVPDIVDSAPTSGSSNYVTSGGVYTALSDKADKVSSPTANDFAALDSNGNITDSTHKDSDYVHIAEDEDITGGKTFKQPVIIQHGNGKGTLIFGADVNANTLTASTRKLGRINSPIFSASSSSVSTDGNTATLLGWDTQGHVSGDDMHTQNKANDVVAFGGMKKITNTTSPMNIVFCVATERGATVANKKVYPIEMDCNEVRFNVQPNYNGTNIVPVSGTNDGTNWTSITIGSVTKNIPSGGGGGGLSDYDFTHIGNTTVSTSTTITFAADTRGSQMVSTSADLAVTFAVNNLSDNYLWIKNTGSSDIDITINDVTQNSSSVSNVYVPDDGITIPAGKVCEIGIVVNADGAFITSRSDLSL